MSRRKPADNSATVSLFPFLAVLLCTMGALLVVLVAVSRAAREAAIREGAERQQLAASQKDPLLQAELDKIHQYNQRLKQLRNQAEAEIHKDQLRLGQLESHMRRLHDQLMMLQAAAAELEALEEDHYDDREQAQREVDRLQKLAEETQEAIDKLKEQVDSRKRSYALIPYEGPNGTYRRPIYIECCKNELILQPEGVRIARDDLYPPFSAGNPLASAIRAARNYYVQLQPEEGLSRDTEPYPLLVVRPQGLVMYDRARRAIESADFDFGFELAEEDWKLQFPVADPKLAILEQQAVDQARLRQRALAAAAPRAYRHPALAGTAQFDSGDGFDDGFGYSDEGGEDGHLGGAMGAGEAGFDSSNDSAEYNRYGEVAAGQGHDGIADSSDSSEGGDTNATETAGGSTPPPRPAGAAMSDSQEQSAAASAGASSNGMSAGGSADADQSSAAQMVASADADPPEFGNAAPTRAGSARGQDWALDRKKPNSVPIRRTIQVVVAGDQLLILSDDADVDRPNPAGKRIEFQGDTAESLDQIVAAVRSHIDGWGIAGQGLYWRPVLILNCGPTGERRANDLNRLLKNSGIELRNAEFLNTNPQSR